MKSFDCSRDWDGDSDCDWVLTFSSCSLADEANDIINEDDFYSSRDGHRVYVEGITVLGNDSGIVSVCELLKKNGFVEV